MASQPSSPSSSPGRRPSKEDSGIVLAAAPGIENAPKPSNRPMIELLSDVSWMKFNSEHDGGEPEQVHKEVISRARGGSQHTCDEDTDPPEFVTVELVSKVHQSWIPVVGAFALGMASMVVCRMLYPSRSLSRA